MKQTAKNVSPWKLGSVTVLGILLFIGFACSEEIDNDIKKMGEQSNAISFDQLPVDMQTDLVGIKEDLSFIKTEVGDNDKMSNIKELQELDPKLIHSINIDKDKRTIYIAIKKDGANFDYISEKSKGEGDVFTVVENQPDYPGGMTEFYRYVGSEMEYPEQARKAGVEGRVYVQFVVETDGSLSEVKTVKGIGSGCDEEAKRVIENVTKFIPGAQRGKPVRVRMVMPIAFKLNGDNQNDVGSQEVVIVEEYAGNEGMQHDDGSDQVVIMEEPMNVKEKLNVNVFYSEGTWTGTVYNQDGAVMPGANIVAAGTNKGTVADRDGSFKLKTDNSSELVISFVGYEKVKIKPE